MQPATTSAGAIEAMPARIDLRGAVLDLDVSGAAYWRAEKALLVADLHLEKGSAFARKGQLLPPYDSAATLARLNAALARHDVRRLILLGDSFHDRFAGERLAAETLAALIALGRGRDLVWIAGNHDPAPPAGLPGERLAELALGPLVLRHEPRRGAGGEVAGHLHPVAKVATRAGAVRRPCFVSDAERLILPAFGAFAGGLNLRHAAIAALVPLPVVHVLTAQRVLRIAPERVLP